MFCKSVHISIALASRVSQNPSKRKLTANSLQAINCLSYTESSYQQQQLLQPKGSQLVPQRRLLSDRKKSYVRAQFSDGILRLPPLKQVNDDVRLLDLLMRGNCHTVV